MLKVKYEARGINKRHSIVVDRYNGIPFPYRKECVGVNIPDFPRFPDVEKGTLYCAGMEKGTIIRCGVVVGGPRMNGKFKRIRPNYIRYHSTDVD